MAPMSIRATMSRAPKQLPLRDLCTTSKFLIQCRKWRWGEAMARRDFRQLGLADSIVRRRGKKSEWLERLDGALDWPALERIVAGVYASREGGLAYPLLTCVKLLLLQQWYGLSDEGLEARSTTGSRSAASPASRWPRAS